MQPDLARITDDDLWPRTAAYRYRLYARDSDGLRVLGASPDPGGLGLMIVALHEDQRQSNPDDPKAALSDLGHIGILDVLGHGEGVDTGVWIVRPYPPART